MDRRTEYLSSRQTVFFVHISGWTPCATDHWRGPYQSISSAIAQAIRITRKKDGTDYGDWTAKIFRLDGDSLTLVEVKM